MHSRTVALPAEQPTPFRIDDDEFTLPALPTRQWIDALALTPPGCWWRLIPGSVDEPGHDRLLWRLFDPDDPFDLDELEHAATTVAAAVCGMECWPATRLAAAVVTNWTVFDGWSYSHGVDPLAQPPHRVLNGCYMWRRELCEKQSDATRLDHDVFAPPPPHTASGRPRNYTPAGWDDDQEAAVFQQALAQAGGGRG